MAVILPGLAEADVACADTGPSDDRGETRDGQHPVEGLCSYVGARCDYKADEPKCGDHKDGYQWASRLINVAEDFGCLSAVGEGGHCAAGAVYGGVSN